MVPVCLVEHQCDVQGETRLDVRRPLVDGCSSRCFAAFSKTLISAPCPATIYDACRDTTNVFFLGTTGQPFTLRDCLSWFCPELPWQANARSVEEGNQSGSLPLVERNDDRQTAASEGDVAQDPVMSSSADGGQHESHAVGFAGFESSGSALLRLPSVVVQGVEPPLDAPVARLWSALRHPDHFLYIVLRMS